MKLSKALHSFMLAGTLLGATGSLHAQTAFYWDADGDTTEETGGSGIWDSGSSLWRSGSAIGTLAQWPNTDPAVDYAQLAGTAGTVTLNSDSVNLNVNRIIFGTTGYEIKGPVSGTATVNLSGTSPQINTGTSVSATISANISGATGLTKIGAGTLTLSGANTYSGTTSVNAGSLTVQGTHSGGGWSISNSAANTALTFATGSMISVGAGGNIVTAAGGGSAARNIAVAGTVSSSGTSDVTIQGRNNLSISNGGSWTMQGGTLAVSVGNSGYGANLNVNAGASFTYSGSNPIIVADGTGNSVANANLNLRGSFTTTTGFINTGAGTGTGTSNFNFDGGTLKISNDITSIFTQDTQPFNISMGTGGGIIDTNGFNTATSVGITGAGGMTKASAGTLTLSGTNTYNGATTVSAGSLYVTGALSNSAVIVEANGTISSNGSAGTLGNGLTIQEGGNLDLTGATVGLNSTGILSLTGGSLTLGKLTFQDLTGWDWMAAAPGTYELIDGAFSINWGNTAYLSEETAYDFGNGRKGYFTSGSLNAVIIPEPAAALLGGLGMLALLRRKRTH